MIPKIIHQIWLDDDLPLQLKMASDSIKSIHKGYKYNLWRKEDLKDFELDHLIGKVHPIRLANILKIKLLTTFGGWYFDIDIAGKGSLGNLPTYILNSKICVNLRLDGMNKTFGNSIVGCEKYYDFSLLLREYESTSSSEMKNHWNVFCKKNEVTQIPYEFFNRSGTLFMDLKLKTWKKDHKESENIQSYSMDSRHREIINNKIVHKENGTIQTKSPFYKRTYK